MWDEAGPVHGISSMMRATGFTVAIAVRMVAAGKIKEKGIVPPEDGTYGPLHYELIRELARRNIIICEVTTPMV